MVDPPPQSWSEVWALTPHIVYSWVQQTPLAWQPEGTPSGGLRVELTIHNSTGVFESKSAMLSYIDGAATLIRYVGEEMGTGVLNGRWAKLATATPPEEYNLLLSDGISVQDGLTAVYRKNQFGEVVVHGDLVGQMQNGSVIATLPAGFRPIYTLEMPATCDFTAGRIQVNSAGEIRVTSQLSECSSLYFLAVFVAGG